jgi:hypothetical protein
MTAQIFPYFCTPLIFEELLFGKCRGIVFHVGPKKVCGFITELTCTLEKIFQKKLSRSGSIRIGLCFFACYRLPFDAQDYGGPNHNRTLKG